MSAPDTGAIQAALLGLLEADASLVAEIPADDMRDRGDEPVSNLPGLVLGIGNLDHLSMNEGPILSSGVPFSIEVKARSGTQVRRLAKLVTDAVHGKHLAPSVGRPMQPRITFQGPSQFNPEPRFSRIILTGEAVAQSA